MILVDSSVWIEYLRGSDAPEAGLLDRALSEERLVVGDLIYLKVMRGVRDAQIARVGRQLRTCEFQALGGRATIEAAVDHHRMLRARGITIRRTIDIVIATHCILNDLRLLHRDHDFDPFEQHLGLQPPRIIA